MGRKHYSDPRHNTPVQGLEFIMRKLPPLVLLLTTTALLGLACAPLQRTVDGIAALRTAPLELDAQGPGTVFPTVEAAAVDALTWSYRQAREARDTERLRAGTIHPVGNGYSYGEIHEAGSWNLSEVTYSLKPQDAARFHIYPQNSDFVVNRMNERPSRSDRRSVSVVDPLHRPLYILHPSLVIREYRGEDQELVEAADLRRREEAPRIAGR
jgi:hypothetical protein